MDANAAINVYGNNVQLSIEGSTIYGCDEMWSNISVSPFSKLSLKSSTIKDGKNAVYAIEGSTLTVDDNEFINNYIGLNLYSFSIFGQFGTNTSITGNIFKTAGTLLPPYSGDLGFAGIKSEYCHGFTIGNTNQAASPNEFETLQNGIVSKTSSFTVHGASFFDIDVPGAPVVKGNGIYLEQGSNAIVSACDFELIWMGIQSSNSSMEVYDCQFNDTPTEGLGITTCIQAIGSVGKPVIKIHDNTMATVNYGINIIEMGSASVVEVRDNMLTVGDVGVDPFYSGKVGINLVNSFFPATSKGMVKGNTIIVNSSITGIGIYGSNIDVIQNAINISDDLGTPIIRGISTGDSYNLNIYDNTITSAQQQHVVNGMAILTTTKSRLCCNTVNGFDSNNGFTAVKMEGVCLGTQLRGTTFGNATVGLLYQPDLLTGQTTNHQINANNQWTGTYADIGARHGGNEQSVLMSIYKVSPFTPPTLPPSIDASAQWFWQGSPAGFACTFQTNCSSDIIPFPPDTASYIIAGGNWNTGLDYQPTLNWAAERELYGDIALQPDWKTQYPEMLAFYNAKQGTSVQQFHDFDAHREALNAGNANTAIAVANNNEAIRVKMEAIKAKDAQLYGASGGQGALLEAEKAVLLSELMVLVSNGQSLSTSLDADRSALVGSMSTINSSVNAVQVFETNLKSVNAIWLATWAVGIHNFTPNQLATLQSVAEQCPKNGGCAVSMARSMVNTIMQVDFDDDELCNFERSVAPRHSLNLSGIGIYPNPANHTVTISSESKLTLKGKLLVVDSFGRLIREVALSGLAPSVTFDVNDLRNGVYFIKHIEDGHVLTAGRIVVNH